MKDVVQKQIQAYQSNFIKFGVSPLGTFQNNTTTQQERFYQLLKPFIDISTESFSICDIGSGVCDLHAYLNQRGIKHEYTGIEIVPEMVSASKLLYPEINVLEGDILETIDFSEKKFDFVVLSGVFNLPGEVSNDEWEVFVFRMIENMFEISNKAISFNALTTYTTFRSEELYYLDSFKVIEFIQRKLSRFYSLNSSYPLYENTYTIYKESYIEESFPAQEFKKYFKAKK
jgi:hypothetical protein